MHDDNEHDDGRQQHRRIFHASREKHAKKSNPISRSRRRGLTRGKSPGVLLRYRSSARDRAPTPAWKKKKGNPGRTLLRDRTGKSEWRLDAESSRGKAYDRSDGILKWRTCFRRYDCSRHRNVKNDIAATLAVKKWHIVLHVSSRERRLSYFYQAQLITWQIHFHEIQPTDKSHLRLSFIRSRWN